MGKGSWILYQLTAGERQSKLHMPSKSINMHGMILKFHVLIILAQLIAIHDIVVIIIKICLNVVQWLHDTIKSIYITFWEDIFLHHRLDTSLFSEHLFSEKHTILR